MLVDICPLTGQIEVQKHIDLVIGACIIWLSISELLLLIYRSINELEKFVIINKKTSNIILFNNYSRLGRKVNHLKN